MSYTYKILSNYENVFKILHVVMLIGYFRTLFVDMTYYYTISLVHFLNGTSENMT